MSVEVHRVNRRFVTLLFVAAVVSSGCSAGTAEESAPCYLLREEDAAALLGGPVEAVGFAEYVAASSTIPAEEQAQVDAAAEAICMYKDDAGALASLQLDRDLFENEKQFRSAFEEDVEVLEEPGLAANYQTGAGDRNATHFGVLLNKDGDSIALSVSGAEVTKEKMSKVAESIVDRY